MAEILYESYYGVMPLSTNYIEHHGVKGQKHGHRRWQNHDGSLTPEGRIHYGVGPARNSARTDNDRISRIVGKKTEEEQARNNAENHRQLKQYRLEELTNAITNSKFSRNPMSEDEMNERARKLGYRDIDEAIDAFVKYDREQNKKANSTAAERAESKEQRMWFGGPTKEKFIEMAKAGRISTKAIEEQFDKLSLAEIKQIQKAAKENKEKEETISSILKERRGKAESARDLRQQRKEAKQEAAKEAAIKAGDAGEIAKFAKTMTTEELQSALDRVNKVNTLNQKAIDQAAEKKAKREAQIANIQEQVSGISSAISYWKKANKEKKEGGEGPKLSEIWKTYQAGKGKGDIELTGAAKKAYEENVVNAAKKAADKKRESLIKYGASERSAEKAAKNVILTMLKDIKAADKEKDKDKDKDKKSNGPVINVFVDRDGDAKTTTESKKKDDSSKKENSSKSKSTGASGAHDAAWNAFGDTLKGGTSNDKKKKKNNKK